MQAGKNQASQKPTAFGSMLQASTYGLVIPEIYGRTQGPLYAIWAANLRRGGSTKKFKQLKKGITAYCENIDFLCGKNPIISPLQAWSNGTLYPLTFTSWSTTATAGSSGVFTVPDAHLYAVIAVTLTVAYSETFNDFGAPGPATLAGSMEVPLWNQLFAGPDPCDSTDPRNFPYRYRWDPSYGATIHIDDLPYGALPTGTLKVYYAQMTSATKNQPPISRLLLSFENILGSGDEYDGFSSQQIQYPMYAGFGSPNIDLGSTGAIPAIKIEHLGKWAVSKDGDCDFVDIIEDVVKNGISQSAMGGGGNWESVGHGASCFNLPGTIQKKLATSTNASGVPPMLYDMPNTAGNILVCTAKGQAALSISSSNGEAWTPLFGSGGAYNMWYATAVGGPNTVTVSGAGQPSEVAIFEIGGVGQASLAIDSASTFPASVSGDATATITKDFAASAVGAPQTIFGHWSNFVFMGPLPGDAVIQGIYAVANMRFINATGLSGQLSWGNTAGDGGSTTVLPSSAADVSGAFGTNLSRALAGAKISASISGSTSSGGEFVPPAEIDVYSCGIAVLYSSATAPSGSPWLPDPFSPPAGQYFAWALPATYTKENEYYNPGGPGPGPIFSPFGIQLAPGTAYEFSPAPAITDTTPLVRVNDGVFSSDLSATNSTDAVITATVNQGWPEFIMAVPFYDGDSPASAQVAKYEALTPENFYSSVLADMQAHGRIVYNPSTLTFKAPGTTAKAIGMIGVKWTDAPRFARPGGGFMHLPSLDNTRAMCRAGGLFGSLAMIAQKPASDWLKDLYEAANAFPVFTGHQLRTVARSEVSAVGNGAIYIAPTSAGPVIDLDVDNGDFVAEKGQPAIRFTRKARTDTDTVLQMQHLNRDSNYQQVTTAEPDSISIAKYGVRKKDPDNNDAVQAVTIARTILRIRVRRRNYIDPFGIAFTLNQRLSWLDSTDLVTITDRARGIVKMPARLISWEENDKLEIACEAERFAWGIHAPQALPATSTAPYSPGGDVDLTAGDVNAPVIFEPVPRMYGSGAQPQLWLVVSSPATNYGGCQTYISTDGGASYNPIGDPLSGSAITGASTASWAANADPDTTHDLPLDLTESNGVLQSFAVSDEDNFLYLCYIAGGAGSIPYELMTYAVATLTSANHYALKATGGGNKLRRSVFGAPTVGAGVTHSSGSRWAFLSPVGTGILKLPLDPTWIGVTLHFKFVSFNNFGGGVQSLADVTDYTYTPTGLAEGLGGASGFLINGA